MLIYYATVDGQMIVSTDMADIFSAAYAHSSNVTGTIWQNGKRIGEFTVKGYK